MPTLRVADLVDATGGRLLRGDAAETLTSYDIDTRALAPGSAFFALAGERTDGHRFLPQAYRAGAKLAVVERDVPDDGEGPPAILRVDSVERALWAGGERARAAVDGAGFVAVAGSTGKTTTKEMTATALAVDGPTHRTAGNRNNHLGVPLTLLACPDDARHAVVEVGMNAPGEVAGLARLARPSIGVVTNVRPEHMEFFRALDDVAAAEGELYAVLSDDGTSVVNLDDVHARIQGLRHGGRQVTFGEGDRADVRLVRVEARFRPGTRFSFAVDGRERDVQMKLGGVHAAWNALAALAVVHAAGVDLDAAAAALAEIEPGPGRGQVHALTDGVVLVDDSYNCSPGALQAVLEVVRTEPDCDRRVLVLGDMLEMGREGPAYHEAAGRQAGAAGVGLLIGVGPLSRRALEAARRAGVAETFHADDADAAARLLAERIRPRDLVVIKGSRGIRLERTVHAVVHGRFGGGR